MLPGPLGGRGPQGPRGPRGRAGISGQMVSEMAVPSEVTRFNLTSYSSIRGGGG